ncbi:hypothetical protein TWF106_005036 [Orbilia oligospora]|uniref:Uncharacterized protein n=1 Tax=Orbilia oligospora TaxID=2813651 RepID=A0A6G1LTK4_ORBOL|nr:hypothetical protein TWF788_002831 [Orbilia oligospora]KAF3196284.1 hypothetical protein TWF106_005036 [Orbilia oligospora]KAF3205698.1 hypothetical protein TWF679_009247 [Orbilia oligospora]KAF3210255.1 hypothetical protein TWF191_011215 [Orbilia oligospora]KAF3234096.1 hypothetical protein TWF192_001657 [Orbilia oligospora]
MEAKSAPAAADKHEEPTVVEASSTPIELLAEATQLAREALAHHAKTQALHASNPNDPAQDSSSPVLTTQENEALGISKDVGGFDAEKQSSAGAGTDAGTGTGTGTGAGLKAVAPPLSIPVPAGKHDDSNQRDTTTPPNERKTPSDEMVISPIIAATPHPNIGNKRTASGAIKAPSTSLPATPYQPATSSPRNGRERIGELSTQLRSRLSYAMIKMQNGLQGQSFDQVENYIVEKRQNRLSQSPSITASNTPLIPPATIGSVQTGAASQPLKRQTSVDSYSGGLGISLMPSPVPASPRAPHSRVGRHSRTTSDPSAMFLAPAANISSHQDPNYWVKPPPSPLPSNIRGSGHNPNQALDSFAARFQMSPGRHLAPAAPIRHHARSPSGSHTLPVRRGRHPPPSLPKTFSNMSSVSNISSAPTDILSLSEEPLSSQANPSAAVRPCTPVRTNTLTMEQDAVESLMFLSSPGHSQHRGSRPASRSAVSTHQPQFQSQLIQQVWNGGPTDREGDSFMETAASTTVDDEEVRLVEEDDELDKELDRQRKNQEYGEPDTDHELRKEVNGVNSSSRTPQQQGRGDHAARVKRVKTMEEMLSAADRADAAAHWQYTSGTPDKPAAAPVAPSPMLSG